MLFDTTAAIDLPIVCDPNALSAEQTERWMIVGKQMYQAVQEVRELPSGYAFRLPSDTAMLMTIAEDLSLERLCCPFLHFTLEIESKDKPIWLSFTGGAGAKEFLKFSFESADLIDEVVAKVAGFSVSERIELNSVQTALETTNAINERFAQANAASHKD